MHATVAERAGEIRSVVCRVLEVDGPEVSDTALFIDDLGADSMKLIELLANLEIEFDVEIDEAEFDRLVNLTGVYDVLSAALDEHGRHASVEATQGEVTPRSQNLGEGDSPSGDRG